MHPQIIIDPKCPSLDPSKPSGCRGCADGYVAVDSTHPWYGLSAKKVETEMIRLKHKSVHGGVIRRRGTIKGRRVPFFGFTTDHKGDTPDNWPLTRVIDETLHLWRAARRVASEAAVKKLQKSVTAKSKIKNEDPIPQAAGGA